MIKKSLTLSVLSVVKDTFLSKSSSHSLCVDTSYSKVASVLTTCFSSSPRLSYFVELVRSQKLEFFTSKPYGDIVRRPYKGQNNKGLSFLRVFVHLYVFRVVQKTKVEGQGMEKST